MSEQSLLGVDYQNQPNFDAWWTPGWSSQNQSYLPVPTNVFAEPGFPTTAKYITVTGNFFDSDGNPLSGYLTFWPSDPLTFTVAGVTTVIPQRRVGVNNTMLGINQFGDGRVYLWNGQLVVQLLATNNTGQTPPNITYHVVEHWIGGQEYDITVPITTAQNTDIHSLIINGPSASGIDFDEEDIIRQAAISTQYVPVSIDITSGAIEINPETSTVFFSFQQIGIEPTAGQWTQGAWISATTPPYYAQILVGPAGAVSTLAVGTYIIWVQVNATPQVIAFPVGQLVIY